MKNNIAVVTSSNGNVYQSKRIEKDNNEFENVTKGGSGILNDKQCKDLFTIPVVLNKIVNENPLALEMIRRLKLAYIKK